MATAPPLSHHDVLTLVAPFSRRGRPVDLPASDRGARKLLFRPVEHPGADGRPALREVLSLESFGTGTCRLTRTLTGPGGVQATLQTQGSDIARLLDRIERVDPQQHFHTGPGWVVARSHWTDAVAGTLVLTRGEVRVDGLALVMTVSMVRGVSAELVLTPAPGLTTDLPEDLLAVLGWDWARLVKAPGRWTTRLRLRGNALRRTRRAEAALDRAALHLARTLAEPPARYHEAHLAARWGVVLRRSIPVLTPVALLITVLGMPKLDTSGGPGLWWLLYHVPTVLIALSFCLQELPRFEIPPLPRRSRLASWRQGASEATAQDGSRASSSGTVVS